VPELKGLTLKSAIHRVVLAGGVPYLDGLDAGGATAYRVQDQSPPAGAALEPQSVVTIKLRAP
jgi:hypothetical protein